MIDPARRPGDRWELIWSHREKLLEVARSRSTIAEDAEDAVQEAMLRAGADQGIPGERLGTWLTATTVRLCAARRRQALHDTALRTTNVLTPVEPPPVEEAACDRAEARWLAERGSELPARQAEVLRLAAQDLGVGQIARATGLSYRATESLLARARRTLRQVLATTMALVTPLWLCARRLPRVGGAPSAATASTAVTLAAVAGLTLPADSAPPADGSPPRAAVPHRAPAPHRLPEEAREDQRSPGGRSRPVAATDSRKVPRRSPKPSVPPGTAAVGVQLGTLVEDLAAVAAPILSLPADLSDDVPGAVPHNGPGVVPDVIVPRPGTIGEVRASADPDPRLAGEVDALRQPTGSRPTRTHPPVPLPDAAPVSG